MELSDLLAAEAALPSIPKVVALLVSEVQRDEVDLRKSYVPKFSKVLPAGKVARYYQIESKIRTAVKADLASGIPLITQ